MFILYLIFIAAFTAANLIVKHFGAPGLWFSSALLIPFDFVARCVIHERFKGAALILRLLALTVAAALVTIAINWDAKNIASASVAGFCAAQLAAGIAYQWLLKERVNNYFFKVNFTDLLAIFFDSIVFQIVAFGTLDTAVTKGQIAIKFAGGLIWYFVIFKKLKLHERFINRS